ncbi:ABC transporter permease [Devosia sp. FJ2-5-3]|jgi:peptide/nickel transport system permease protein|uniref:ABC transporter permease n=1 Tax=Devosia sp. FJ2-5-3 TaxID=2976680 RepID=UPI0023D8273F|nr:ABC transporter permease [Devosia sp. FJ2-5-3]WEJ60123.1 ABC transporter permease [Devosia sp. FJ2-5-3]
MNLQFLVTKLFRGALTLLLAVTFVFIVLRASGDPAQIMMSDEASPDAIAAFRERWGLDKSMFEQYLTYLGAMLQGDFGNSFRDGRPALEVIAERVPVTLQLGLAALLITLAVGIPAGVMAALKRGTWVDQATMSFTILGHSIPNFFLGILLILLFSMTLRWLPSSGTGSIWHLLMPAITLGTAAAATVARFTRSSMLDVLHQPFMRTAKAKGIPHERRVLRHAIPNAAIPVVTVVGMRIGGLIGGAVTIETVFAWPGVGMLLVNAVNQRDLAVVQGVVLLIAFTMVAVNLIVDLAYGWLDPRIELQSKKAATA